MILGIISLVSDVHDPDAINRTSGVLLQELANTFEIRHIQPQQMGEVDIPLVFVKTGGTENKFKAVAGHFRDNGLPVTLLTTGSNNSLAASLEILSWLNQSGFRNPLLLHGELSDMLTKLRSRFRLVDMIRNLTQTRIGVLGKPSDWLIASEVDYLSVQERWGVSIQDIDIKDVIDRIQAVPESRIIEAIPQFSESGSLDGIGIEDFGPAVQIYLGIQQAIIDFQLTAVTLRCFDLIAPLQSTGCLALARLNDEGIPAGCEGDIPALFTMILNHLIQSRPTFMANPSGIFQDRIRFAHCTVPLSMTVSHSYKSHFESGIGVAVSGGFPSLGMTISKIGGRKLDRFYVDEADFSGNSSDADLCRTQLWLKPRKGVRYFTTSPLGNHHIIGTDQYADSFRLLMQSLGCREVG